MLLHDGFIDALMRQHVLALAGQQDVLGHADTAQAEEIWQGFCADVSTRSGVF